MVHGAMAVLESIEKGLPGTCPVEQAGDGEEVGGMEHEQALETRDAAQVVRTKVGMTSHRPFGRRFGKPGMVAAVYLAQNELAAVAMCFSAREQQSCLQSLG